MSFTQKFGARVLYCTGCEYRCRYGAVKDKTAKGYLPSVGGVVLRDYVAAGGYRVILKPNFFEDRALEMAYKISQLCDNYKAR